MGWQKFEDGAKAHFGHAYLFQAENGRPFIGLIEKCSDTEGILVVSDGTVKDFYGHVPTPVAFHELPAPYKAENDGDGGMDE